MCGYSCFSEIVFQLRTRNQTIMILHLHASILEHSFTRAIVEKLRKQYEIISNTYSPSTSGNCCRMSHENTLSHGNYYIYNT